MAALAVSSPLLIVSWSMPLGSIASYPISHSSQLGGWSPSGLALQLVFLCMAELLGKTNYKTIGKANLFSKKRKINSFRRKKATSKGGVEKRLNFLKRLMARLFWRESTLSGNSTHQQNPPVLPMDVSTLQASECHLTKQVDSQETGLTDHQQALDKIASSLKASGAGHQKWECAVKDYLQACEERRGPSQEAPSPQ